jgi:hypothetical protein
MWRKSLDTVHLGNERLTGDRSHTRVDKRNALRYLTCPRPREFGASESNTMLSSSRDALWFSAGVGKAFLDAWPVFRSECRTSRCRRSRCSGEIRQKRFTGGQGTGNSSLGTGHIRGRTKATPLISDLSPFYLAPLTRGNRRAVAPSTAVADVARIFGHGSLGKRAAHRGQATYASGQTQRPPIFGLSPIRPNGDRPQSGRPTDSLQP